MAEQDLLTRALAYMGMLYQMAKDSAERMEPALFPKMSIYPDGSGGIVAGPVKSYLVIASVGGQRSAFEAGFRFSGLNDLDKRLAERGF